MCLHGSLTANGSFGRTYVMKLIALLIALIFTLCTCGNGARERGEQAKPSSEPVASRPEQRVAVQPTSTQRSITLDSQRETAAEPVVPAVVESRPIQQRDRILSMRKGELYRAEDFEIGALQGYTNNAEIIKIMARIRSFQIGMRNGSIPLEDVHPEWETQAQRNISFYLDRGYLPLDVRVGLIRMDEPDKASADIRLSGDPGYAIGEIYLQKDDDVWLVADLQIDLVDLAETPEGREDLYEPSVYRMMNLP